MSKTSKITPIIIGGVSVASGALLAAWLLTGTRKEKTKKLISRGTNTLRGSLKKERSVYDDSEINYV
jgi:hypothetical protein